MGSLTIYNTNGDCVYPNRPTINIQNKVLQGLIDNVVEYYIDQNKNRIAALVQADAPQVDNREKANFYAVFESAGDIDLLTGIADKLEILSKESDWEFHTDEIRAYTLWLVAECAKQNHVELDATSSVLLSIQRLISEDEAVDLGFEDHKRASQAVQYFVTQCSENASYAIASNGRPFPSVNVVLSPGEHGDFTFISENARKMIMNMQGQLREEAYSFYVESTKKQISNITQQQDLSLPGALAKLRKLYRISDSICSTEIEETNSVGTDIQNIVNKITALKKGNRMENRPSVVILKEWENKQPVEEIQRKIDQKYESARKSFRKQLTDETEQDLSKLADGDSAHAASEIKQLEAQLSGGPEYDLSANSQPVESILQRASHVQQQQMISKNEKGKMIADIKETVSSFRTDLQYTRAIKYESEIQASVQELPSYKSSRDDAVQSALYTYRSTSGHTLHSSVPECVDQIAKLRDNINQNKLIADEAKDQLLERLRKKVVGYKETIVSKEQARFRSEIDKHLRYMDSDLSYASQHEVIAKRFEIFNHNVNAEDPLLSRLQSLKSDIEEHQLFTSKQKRRLTYEIEEKLREQISKTQKSKVEKMTTKFEYYLSQIVSQEGVAAENQLASLKHIEDITTELIQVNAKKPDTTDQIKKQQRKVSRLIKDKYAKNLFNLIKEVNSESSNFDRAAKNNFLKNIKHSIRKFRLPFRVTDYVKKVYDNKDSVREIDESLRDINDIKSWIQGEEVDALPPQIEKGIEQMGVHVERQSYIAILKERALPVINDANTDLLQKRNQLLRSDIESQIADVMSDRSVQVTKIKNLSKLISKIDPGLYNGDIDGQTSVVSNSQVYEIVHIMMKCLNQSEQELLIEFKSHLSDNKKLSRENNDVIYITYRILIKLCDKRILNKKEFDEIQNMLKTYTHILEQRGSAGSSDGYIF